MIESNGRSELEERQSKLPHLVKQAAEPKPVVRQARALDILAHAVQHLTDSRLLHNPWRDRSGDDDAIHLMRRLNRAVFIDCQTDDRKTGQSGR